MAEAEQGTPARGLHGRLPLGDELVAHGVLLSCRGCERAVWAGCAPAQDRAALQCAVRR